MLSNILLYKAIAPQAGRTRCVCSASLFLYFMDALSVFGLINQLSSNPNIHVYPFIDIGTGSSAVFKPSEYTTIKTLSFEYDPAFLILFASPLVSGPGLDYIKPHMWNSASSLILIYPVYDLNIATSSFEITDSITLKSTSFNDGNLMLFMAKPVANHLSIMVYFNYGNTQGQNSNFCIYTIQGYLICK